MKSRISSLTLLFAATIFVSAVLLFSVEPMIAKMLLPVLGGTPAVWNTCMVFFQAALLAGDHEEATELVEKHAAQHSLAEVYDTVLIPALALAESDRRRGDIDEGRQKFIFQSLKDLVEDLGGRQKEGVPQPADGVAVETHDSADLVILSTLAKPCILLLPARNEADVIARANANAGQR
jgi:hypothetical protein